MLRVYFEPGADIGAAIAQMTAVSSTALRAMPPGMTPPVILQYNATNVHWLSQLTLSSQNHVRIEDFRFMRSRFYPPAFIHHSGACNTGPLWRYTSGK